MLATIVALVLVAKQESLTAESVKAASTAIRAVDPADTDYGDLQFLKQKVGDARIVFLGEQSHGDGQTFLGKTRFIRFLHEQMGFDVLAWESGLYDCRLMDQAFKEGEPPLEAAGKGVFKLWSKSEQVRPLWEYVAEQRKGDHPLFMAGFDCQFSSPAGPSKFFPEIEAMFDGLDKKALPPEARQHLAQAKTLLGRASQAKPEDLESLKQGAQGLLAAFQAHERDFGKTLGRPEVSFRERCLRNWVNVIDLVIGMKAAKGAAFNNIRDAAMAGNLEYLANEVFKGKKIIVWSASFHNLRAPELIQAGEMNYAETVTFGKRLAGRIPSYSIAFTGYQGQGGVAGGKPFDIPPAPEGSVEALVGAQAGEFFFVDLSRLPGSYVAQPLGYSPMLGEWGKNFDALVFTRTLKPSTLAAGG